MNTSTTVTIINSRRRANGRLAATVRKGPSVVEFHELNSIDLEAARAEAQAMFPYHRVIIPRLGEK